MKSIRANRSQLVSLVMGGIMHMSTYHLCRMVRARIRTKGKGKGKVMVIPTVMDNQHPPPQLSHPDHQLQVHREHRWQHQGLLIHMPPITEELIPMQHMEDIRRSCSIVSIDRLVVKFPH